MLSKLIFEISTFKFGGTTLDLVGSIATVTTSRLAHCKGNLVPTRKQVAYYLSGTKGPKKVQDLWFNKIVLMATD